MYGDERCVLDTTRFLDLLLTLIFEGRDALPKPVYSATSTSSSSSSLQQQQQQRQIGPPPPPPPPPSIIDNELRGASDEENLMNSPQTSTLTNTSSVQRSILSQKPPNKRNIDPANEKFYRQLIEWIRVKDSESLIDALESNSVDINFIDDVGQTLLNWAAAFGTAEMVEYLAAKGADVNKGQRSSSLHYAACFGRANIVKILLRHGANPELRDEEGKTPLDKARERGEENHREVVQILQSPTDYITLISPVNDEIESNNIAVIETVASSFLSNENHAMIQEASTITNIMSSDSELVNLDEVKLNYTKRLIPIFCKVFLNCMIQSINKSCLNLLRKLISYASKDQLNRIVQMSVDLEYNYQLQQQQQNETTTVSTLLVELIAKVLQENQNYESIFIGLSISNDLFCKCSPFILEEYTRLGVGQLISHLASGASFMSPSDDETEETIATKSVVKSDEESKNEPENLDEDELDEDSCCQNSAATALRSSTSEILADNAYLWKKQWCIVYHKEFIYVWNQHCCIELSHNSNGWFRFLLNNKLFSMYSNGQPEESADSDENMPIFVNKLLKAKQQCQTLNGGQSYNLFDESISKSEIKLENWIFSITESDELHIANMFADQKTILRGSMLGFEFRSNKNELHKFLADQELINEDLKLSWLSSPIIAPKLLKTKTKSKLKPINNDQSLANTILDRHLAIKQTKSPNKLNQSIPPPPLSTSSADGSTSARLSALQQYLSALSVKSSKLKQKQIKKNIKKLALKLHQDYLYKIQARPRDLALKLISVVGAIQEACSKHDLNDADWRPGYEKALNELKQVLMETNKSISSYELSISGLVPSLLRALCSLNEKSTERIKIFSETFEIHHSNCISNNNNKSVVVYLLHKLIALFESIEKLPLYLYDAPGSYNLQAFSKRFKLLLTKGQSEPNFLDFSGRVLKVEPLANVSHLEKYIAKMVTKQWY